MHTRSGIALGFLILATAPACDQRSNPTQATSGDNTSVATLSALRVSSGTLAPVFASATTSYTLPVTNDITSITVTPTATSPDATITVNGGAVTSGSASPAIALPVGASTIAVRVATANASTAQSYSITVTRAP